MAIRSNSPHNYHSSTSCPQASTTSDHHCTLWSPSVAPVQLQSFPYHVVSSLPGILHYKVWDGPFHSPMNNYHNLLELKYKKNIYIRCSYYFPPIAIVLHDYYFLIRFSFLFFFFALHIIKSNHPSRLRCFNVEEWLKPSCNVNETLFYVDITLRFQC